MSKKASLSVTQRAQVVALSKMKLSERQIVKTCKENTIAVHNAIKKIKKKELLQIRKEQDIPGFLAAGAEAPNEGGSCSLSHHFCSICVIVYFCCSSLAATAAKLYFIVIETSNV